MRGGRRLKYIGKVSKSKPTQGPTITPEAAQKAIREAREKEGSWRRTIHVWDGYWKEMADEA